MKVSEFDIVQIDTAVAKAQGAKFDVFDQALAVVFKDGNCMLFNKPWMENDPFYSPSKNSEQADVIIKSEHITLRSFDGKWMALSSDGMVIQEGLTKEIAAMRCYIESTFGDDFNPEILDEDCVQAKENINIKPKILKL